MEGFDMFANEISFEDFTRFRHKYFEQIEKIERKIQYFIFRSRNFIKKDPFLEDVFLESILVDVRAILMENERYKKNYTMQNSFKINSLGDGSDAISKFASEIDEYMKKTVLPDGQTSFYKAVKFYTDKYIAHRDSTTPDDDRKCAKIKSYFLDDQNFSLAYTVQAIIETAEKFEEEIILRSLESLTNGLDVVELEKTKEDCNSVQDEFETKLTEEILKKSPENIAYLIGLDVQGLQVSDFKPTELKQMILDYIRKLNRTKRSKFIIKVKNLPNKL